MRTTFTIVLLLLTCLSYAKSPVPVPIDAPSKFFYLEIVPGEIKTLNFETLLQKNHCEEDHLLLKTFESTKSYPRIDNGNLLQVKIINIYVQKLLAGCVNNGKSRKLTISYKTPKLNQMLHIYITTDDDISLNE